MVSYINPSYLDSIENFRHRRHGRIIRTTDLLLLGWDYECELTLRGTELHRAGYVVRRWEDKIQIYRKGLPCCLMEASSYSYDEMVHLMQGLKMSID